MEDEKDFLDRLDWYIYINHIRDRLEKHADDHENGMGKLPNGEQVRCGLRKVFHLLDEIEKRRHELQGTPG